MSAMSRSDSGSKMSWMIPVGIYMAGIAAFVLAVSLYNGIGESITDFDSKRLLAMALMGLAGLSISGLLLLVGWLRSSGNRKSDFWIPAFANLFVLVFCFGVLEIGLRVLAQPDPLGDRIGNTVLIPYDWRELADSNTVLYENRLKPEAYFVGDENLGWTVGDSRVSEDGLYVSSVEGLRSEKQGQRYLSENFEYRVALFGDSFIFSQEVSYEDSLAHHLEQTLGPNVQILNFGVPGYGVDQAYLRLQQVKNDWQPDVIVFGFVQDDLFRMANIYLFLKVGWGIPFSKPRYMLGEEGTRLESINAPNIRPPDMYTKKSVFDLPNIERDIEFFAHEWKPSVLHTSFLFRYFTSVFPRWQIRTGSVSDASIVDLGERLLSQFVADTLSTGVLPLVVYMPSKGDFTGQSRQVKQALIDRLNRKGIETINLGQCGDHSIDSLNLFVTNGVHYAGAGNSKAAGCLAPRIRSAF